MSGRWKLLAVAAILAVTSVTLTLALREDDSSDAPTTRRQAIEVDPTPGQTASTDQVNVLISKNAGPALPEDGPYAVKSVERAWTDGYGAFGVTYPSGLGITYQPDSRSQAEAEKAIKGQVDSDTEQFGSSQFFVVDLRDTVALAHEAAADGPASLSWLEGNVWVQVIGYGGESLADLDSLAKSMQSAQAGSTS